MRVLRGPGRCADQGARALVRSPATRATGTRSIFRPGPTSISMRYLPWPKFMHSQPTTGGVPLAWRSAPLRLRAHRPSVASPVALGRKLKGFEIIVRHHARSSTAGFDPHRELAAVSTMCARDEASTCSSRLRPRAVGHGRLAVVIRRSGPRSRSLHVDRNAALTSQRRRFSHLCRGVILAGG